MSDRPLPSALGSRLRAAVVWKAAGQVTAQISRTVMTVTLAHLLAPGDFGLAGLVLIFTGLFQMLSDVGFSASIVQLEELTEDDRSTAFWTGIVIAVVCFCIAVAVSPAIAGFYHEPSVRWMFVVVATGLVLSGLSTTQAALMWRRMDFRALEIRGMVATTVSAVVGIAAACSGLGAWSLIVAAVSGTVVSTATVWVVSPWKPHLVYSFASLRRMALFSMNVFFNRFATYADQNVDNLLVGKFLGTSSLGIYSIGYSVIVIPFERLVWPIVNVLTPAFASVQTDVGVTRDLWLRGLRMISALTFPAMVGVIIVAPDFVSIVLGGKWEASTPIIQILAWVCLVQSIVVLNPPVYQSRFRTGLLLKLGILALALDTTAFALGLHWGVRGVAVGYALTNTVILVPLGIVVICRLLDVGGGAIVRQLRGLVEATAVMALVVGGLRMLLEGEGLAAAERLPILILVGAAVYLLMCWWRDRRIFAELRRRTQVVDSSS